MNIIGELKKAVDYHRVGQLDEAREIYMRLNEVAPLYPDPLHLLGVIAYQTGEYHTAVDFIKRAIDIDSENPAYYNNLGNAYKENGMLDDALASYRKAIDLRPDYAEAYFDLGNAYQQLNRFNDAIAAYQSALKINPLMAEVHNNLGVALFNSDQVEEALSHYQRALQLRTEYVEAYINAGNALKKQERFTEALLWYQRAAEINPNCPEVYANMGFSLQQLGQLTEALAGYQKALQLNPDYGEVFNDLGTLYRELGRQEKALACFQKSADLKPQDPEAFNNMGIVYKAQDRFEEAISSYQKAIELRPDFADAQYNLGTAYWKCGHTEQAIDCYKKAIRLNPDHAYALNLLITRLQQTCAWSELVELVARLNLLTNFALENGRKAAAMPFLTFSLSDDPAYNFRVAKSWADDISTRVSAFYRSSNQQMAFSSNQRQPEKSRISIGYLSADFQNHATVHLMGSLFAFHDPTRFKIIAYSYGKNDHSHFRRKIENGCDKFVDLCKLSNYEAARSIHADEVDILVDLKGYTEGNRLEICGHRPAPIQVAWLGFPGTTGADFLDYIITDRTVTPPDQVPYFSEKIVYMPHTYQVNDCHQKIAEANFRRQNFGLPQDGFIFCSLNEPYKIEPEMFEIWMKVLNRVPGSILWLLKKDGATEENLKNEADLRGVSPERLIFADKLPKDEHLARLQLADLYLDTRIVNGHTTTSDALWAGVPVLTLQGKHFASRVSASLLTALGLPELITFSLSDYEALAVRLASHCDKLKTIKEKLVRNRLTDPLFDTARFTRHLEIAYKQMWQIYLNGEEPRQIEVVNDE